MVDPIFLFKAPAIRNKTIAILYYMESDNGIKVKFSVSLGLFYGGC